MNSLMRKFLGQPKEKAAPAKKPSVPAPSRDNPLTIEDGSENATRRQLVQVLLRDTLRTHGIPLAWIECQMLVVSSRSKGPGVYVRLVVKHFDERFLKYMLTFQNSLMSDIERFEPQAAEWLHGISWQLEYVGGSPFAAMPEKSFWAEPERKAAWAAEPVDFITNPVPRNNFDATQPFEDSNKKDLERLFAIRDKELSQGDTGHVVGYESTQPAPLRSLPPRRPRAAPVVQQPAPEVRS